MAKIDPEQMKRYRVDICYYGTFVLRRAREDYLAKLGKNRPGKGHIPGFAGWGKSSPRNGQAPAEPAAKVPYERVARACIAAMDLKEPSFGEVDTAIAAFAPLARQLGKDFATASAYYESEEHTRDAFTLGGELHDRLTAGFAALDELHEKLGAALAAWRSSHFKDAASMEQGELFAQLAFEDAREVFVTITGAKLDVKALAAGREKLDKSTKALGAYSASDPQDAWTKIMITPLEAFLRITSETKRSATQRAESESFHAAVNGFTTLVEAWQRAVVRSQIAKGVATPAPSPAP